MSIARLPRKPTLRIALCSLTTKATHVASGLIAQASLYRQVTRRC